MSGTVPTPAGTLAKAYCALVALFIAIPIASAFVLSFSEARFPTFPPGDFGLDWYRKAWEDPKDWAALGRTLAIGAAAALTSTLLGFGAAYGDWRYRFRGRNAYLALILLPPTVPLVVLGLAMLAYLSRLGISGQPVAVWVSHVVLGVPFSMAVIRLRLHQMDRNLESAAWNLGATEWGAMRAVVLPFARPAIVASLLLSFAVSFDEFMVAWFVSGIHETLPVRVLNLLQGQVSPRIHVIGVLTFTATLTAVFLAALLASDESRGPA